MSLFPAYGFGCNIAKTRNPLGKVAGYIDTLAYGTYLDSGATINGTGGVVKANSAERSVELSAASYPDECFVTSKCNSCCNS